MSFGMTAASYLGFVGQSGILQSNSGIWSGTTMPVSLPGATSPSSTIALFVAGNTIVPTPGGWTLRQSQVNAMGHYLFTRSGGANSWNITTNNGVGTWYVVEIANAAYDTGAAANDPWDFTAYTTPSLVPSAGNRLLIASFGSLTDTSLARTVSGWTGGFVEVADICNPTSDYPMQGVATLSVTADGVAGYTTGVTYSSLSVGRSAIIAGFIL